MTPPLLALFCCFLSGISVAQSYFAPLGTQWYNSREQFTPVPPNPDFAVFTVVDTVVFQGKKCSAVQGGDDCGQITGTVYIFQENGQVFFTKGPLEPVFPLYDFDAGVGEKFTSYTADGIFKGTFLVTAVETVTVGTQDFKVQHIQVDSGYLFLGEKVVEFVGGRTLFPEYQGCDPLLGSLFCYNNGTFSYPVYPCGVVGTSGIHEPRMQIAPNPASGFFTVQIQDWPAGDRSVRVLDLQGRVMFKTHDPDDALRLDTHDWPNGLYFLQTGSHLRRKVVVQHE